MGPTAERRKAPRHHYVPGLGEKVVCERNPRNRPKGVNLAERERRHYDAKPAMRMDFASYRSKEANGAPDSRIAMAAARGARFP